MDSDSAPQQQTLLPPIEEMYSSTRENRDYNVIRKHEDYKKGPIPKKSITKKGHYLDDSVRQSCSPGPAYKSNCIEEWAPKNAHQPKYSNRKTYIDDVQRIAKKQSCPSPDKYSLTMPWPKRESKVKLICEKTNFIDTSMYESVKSPGPGSYIVASKISSKAKQNKFTPHKPLQPRENPKADMNSYNPCSAEYNTFMKYSLMPKKTGLNTTSDSKAKKEAGQNSGKNKENSPGPGTYQTINTWKGKEALKKNELSYMGHLSRGPSANVYHS